MAVEFIGFISHRLGSETMAPEGPEFNVAYIEENARVHEESGFDRVLVAFGSRAPCSILMSQFVAQITSTLKLMVAHRPGFTAPTVAARQFAILDHLSGGRAGVHIITGGNDVELRQDGDWSRKDDRYDRTGEYLDIMKREWTNEVPFDYEGQYYRVTAAFGDVKPIQKPHIPVYFGGASEAAIKVAGKHADIYALFGETYSDVKDTIARVRAAAAVNGREHRVRFSLSLRPILGETEEAAWARAEQFYHQAMALSKRAGLTPSVHTPQNEGSQRLLQLAGRGSRLDDRLWTAMAAVPGAMGNSTSLVGTPDQVADALLEYHDLGVSTFLIRGYDPIEDARDYGATLIPIFKSKLAARSRPSAKIGSEFINRIERTC